MATAPGIATPEEYVGDTLAREQTSLWADAWRRLKRNRLALASAVLLVLLLVVAVISVFWTPYPIWRQGVASTYQTPNSHFLLGADQAGRDMLSRLMVGAQVSLEVGVGTQIIVAAVGVTIGLMAGYFRGWLVRCQTFALREREFVEAARASGTRPNKILSRHILPNALGPIIVQATFGVPQAILFEAFLSFLGLGVQPPTPSWGAMAADGFHAIRIAPHIVLVPAIALSLTLMAFNFLGDGLRDALDPRQKR